MSRKKLTPLAALLVALLSTAVDAANTHLFFGHGTFSAVRLTLDPAE